MSTQMSLSAAKKQQELTKAVLEPMMKVIKVELDKAVNEIKHDVSVLSESANASMSQQDHSSLTSPSPSSDDIKRQITVALRRADFDQAFKTALMAGNLSLVISTCEMVNPNQLFSQEPCPLSQTVLLSLIQQLCNGLETKTELKHKFLDESLMALDMDDTNTRRHMRAVLGQLLERGQAYMRAYPNEPITKQMRKLVMAADSLIRQCS